MFEKHLNYVEDNVDKNKMRKFGPFPLLHVYSRTALHFIFVKQAPVAPCVLWNSPTASCVSLMLPPLSPAWNLAYHVHRLLLQPSQENAVASTLHGPQCHFPTPLSDHYSFQDTSLCAPAICCYHFILPHYCQCTPLSALFLVPSSQLSTSAQILLPSWLSSSSV